MAFRILSLNAWGGRLHETLLPYLAKVDADLLCLQEVVRSHDGPSETRFYRDGPLELPQRSDLFGEIAALLPGYDGFYLPTSAGPLFAGTQIMPAEFGIATFIRKGLPIVAQAADFVHGSYSPHDWGDHPRPRNAHCVRLYDPRNQRLVTVAHMHGLRTKSGKDESPERIEQGKALRRLIESVWRPGEPLIVCGDFNVLPGSATFDILGELGLRDLVVARGHADTRTSWYEKTPRYADYMLVTPDVEVMRFAVVEQPEVSDHRALVLEIS
ncbi:MAG: endonuclease/exonuclease/phosphatase family protein [Rhizobiaceae bacterium]